MTIQNGRQYRTDDNMLLNNVLGIYKRSSDKNDVTVCLITRIIAFDNSAHSPPMCDSIKKLLFSINVILNMAGIVKHTALAWESNMLRMIVLSHYLSLRDGQKCT